MVIAPVRIKLLTSLLSKEDYGLLTLIMLTVSFITLISSLGSLEFMLRKLPGRPLDFQFKVLRTIVTYFGLLAFAIGGVGAIALIAWSPAKLGLTPLDLVACAAILVLTVHLTQLVFFLMGRSQYAQSRLLMLLYADAWFLPLLALIWFMEISVTFMLWLWVTWLLVSLVASQLYLGVHHLLHARPARKILRDVLVFGLPLMPMIMGEWIFQVVDRYVLLAYMDLQAVANFTLCFNIAWVGAATGTSLLDVLITEFYKARNRVASNAFTDLLANKPLRKSFAMLLRYGLLLGLPILLALWIARTPIVLLLSAPKFANAIPLMRWVAPLPFLYLMGVIAGRTLVAMDRGSVVGKGTLCAAGLHLALSLVLTPTLAERGVALSGCIAYAALGIYLSARARLWRWIDWAELRPGRLILFVAITTIGLYLAVASLGDQHLLALLLGGGISLGAMLGLGLVHKEDIRHLVNSMHAPTEPEEAIPSEPFVQD
jgi:O-antigen/teichoic acid export membrane protein